MQPIGIDDLLGRERYGTQRDVIRRRLADYKRARRVSVGPHCTFVFEDRATVWYQIQEMLWVEQVTDLDAIRDEVAVYNTMLPSPGELSATLLIEIERPAEVAAVLQRLVGIDECVSLEIAGTAAVGATFEPDRQTAEKVSAVQYVRFPVSDASRAAIVGGAAVALAVAHPHYAARAPLPEAVRRSLADELCGPAAPTAALARVRDGGGVQP